MGIDKPKSGEKYQDRKGLYYQIICIGKNTDTDDTMVVYQELFGEFLIWVKPYIDFIREIEKGLMLHYNKEDSYAPLPNDVKEELRSSETIPIEHKIGQVDDESISSLLIEFLDASSYHEKLEIIATNRKKLTDRLINEMAISIDCTVEDGALEDRIDNLMTCLQTMIRFESRRLR